MLIIDFLFFERIKILKVKEGKNLVYMIQM